MIEYYLLADYFLYIRVGFKRVISVFLFGAACGPVG